MLRYLLLLLLASPVLSAQFLPPLHVPLRVTGTFGELRSDHYHAGLDFRARVGTPVYSIGEGFVSRVRVSAGGYGQAIYIDHPDGHRSVYGHLEAFSPELLDTIRKTQYEREAFAVDLAFDSLTFLVSSDQKIGEVGNRGYSFGPHLHFEIRDAITDAALNPLAFDFNIRDTRSPDIRALRVYELGPDQQELNARDFPRLRPTDTIYVASPRVGIGVKAYDRQDAMPNQNGVYGLHLSVDSVTNFRFHHDSIPFEETEYLNGLTDYADWTNNTSWYYRLWLLPGLRKQAANTFFAEATPQGDGSILLTAGKPVAVAIEVYDLAGNVSTRQFTLALDTTLAPASAPRYHQYYLPAGEESRIETDYMTLQVDSQSLYRDLYLSYTKLPDNSDDRFSDTHQIHHPATPLHGRARMEIRPDFSVPDSLREKVFIGRCDREGEVANVGGRWTEHESLATRIGEFGDYAIYLDTVPPSVEIERFSTNQQGAPAFSLIGEGFSRVRAEIDGQWILMEEDAKSGRLTHIYDEYSPVRRGEHELVLRLDDVRGNRFVFRRRFRR